MHGQAEGNGRSPGARSEAGSTLAEVVVATLVLATGVLAMAQLISIASANNLSARHSTVSTILAEQKLEQLRALAFGLDVGGLAASDLSTDTTTVPESPTGGTGLQASPAASLQQNTPGFVDHIGATGQIVGNLTQPPRQAVYTRRWSVEWVAAGVDSALVLQVLVTANRNRGSADLGNVSRLPGEARLVTMKVRKAP